MDHNINVSVDISKCAITSERKALVFVFSIDILDLLNIKQILQNFLPNDLFSYRVDKQVVVVFPLNMLPMHRVQVTQIVVVNIRWTIMPPGRLTNVRKVLDKYLSLSQTRKLRALFRL